MIAEKIFDSIIKPNLSKNKRGFAITYSLLGIFNCICYRLKTGCQWRELPIKQFFEGDCPSWQTIYYHFNRWSKNRDFKALWEKILIKFNSILDLDVINLDGSHTIAKRGGEKVDFQTRKKAKTTNMLYLTDRNGLPLSCSEPESGNHHDSYNLSYSLNLLWTPFISKISRFPALNADSGFDNDILKEFCNQRGIILNVYKNVRNNKNKDIVKIKYKQIYKERFVVERFFAWLDSYKALLVRYEVKSRNWLQLNYLAFSIIFIKNLLKV
ncbi:MAG: IS5 family transposase [Candidatus Sericytochromatia bacterium]